MVPRTDLPAMCTLGPFPSAGGAVSDLERGCQIPPQSHRDLGNGAVAARASRTVTFSMAMVRGPMSAKVIFLKFCCLFEILSKILIARPFLKLEM